MRLLLAIGVLLIVIVVGFMLPLGNGKPLLDADYLQQHWRNPHYLLANPAGLWRQNSGEAVLYRWRDPDGSWQYGQTPPPGVAAEEITVRAPTTISSEQMREGQGPTEF